MIDGQLFWYVVQWPVMAGNLCLLVAVSTRQLVGFKNLGQQWYWIMVTDGALAVIQFMRSTYDHSSTTRGIDLVLTLLWAFNAWTAHKSWKKHRDDDDDFPHQKVWKKIKSLAPSARLAPAGT